MSAIDLMRDGLPPDEINPRNIYNALVRTAASYINRGLTYTDWRGDLARPGMTLAQQARWRSRDKPRTPSAYEKTLHRAWDAADKWAATRPLPWTGDDAASHARAVRALIVADPSNDLTDNQRAVLGHACDVSEATGSRRITIPRRQLQEATGLGLTALRTALTRLEQAGLLICITRGKPRGPAATSKPKAAVYALPSRDALADLLSQCRVTPASGAPPQKASGAPREPPPGAPPTWLVVPPRQAAREPPEPPQGEPVSEVTVTVTGEPSALADLLQAMQGRGITVATPDMPPLPAPRPSGTVTPIRRSTA